MQSFLKDIAASIESGDYFKDAREWYHKKYSFPFIERSYLVLLTTVSITISFIAISVLIDFLPLKTKVPVIVGIEDGVSEYAHLKRLRDPEKDVDSNIALTKSLISGFIDAYESYNYEDNFHKLKRNKKYISQFASDGVFDNYKRYISTRNPNSMTLRYRKHTKRDIEVLKDTFELEKDKNSEKYTAFVNFMSYESNVKGIRKSKWQAKIDFHFSDVKYNRKEKKFLPLDFAITNYNASETR